MEKQIVWEVRNTEKDTVNVNIGEYTSIIDDHYEHEEEILHDINSYFQKRTNRDITIIERTTGEIFSNKEFTSFIFDHSSIDAEHQLAASGLLNKKLQRDLLNSLETEGYLNSINILMEDFLNVLEKDMPLKVKRFDHKQFIKQLTFEYDFTVDYSRLINRLLEIIPLLVDEMNKQSNNNTLLIYLYPESKLSPMEQVELSKLLKSLNINIIVLTDSSTFFSKDLNANNYLRFGEQIITSDLINDMYWESPLNFTREDIKESLHKLINKYSDKFELTPTISNYRVSDIILFESIDIYVCCYFLKRCKHDFDLDISFDYVPDSLYEYLGIFMKTV